MAGKKKQQLGNTAPTAERANPGSRPAGAARVAPVALFWVPSNLPASFVMCGGLKLDARLRGKPPQHWPEQQSPSLICKRCTVFSSDLWVLPHGPVPGTGLSKRQDAAPAWHSGNPKPALRSACAPLGSLRCASVSPSVKWGQYRPSSAPHWPDKSQLLLPFSDKTYCFSSTLPI